MCCFYVENKQYGQIGLKLGVHEGGCRIVTFFSRNVWLKSETESEIDSSTGGAYSGKRKISKKIVGSIGWPKSLN